MPWFFGTKLLLGLSYKWCLSVLFWGSAWLPIWNSVSSRVGVWPLSSGTGTPFLSPSSGQVTLLVHFLQYKGAAWSTNTDSFGFGKFQGNPDNDWNRVGLSGSELEVWFLTKGELSSCPLQSCVLDTHRHPNRPLCKVRSQTQVIM